MQASTWHQSLCSLASAAMAGIGSIRPWGQLGAEPTKTRINQALASLDYIHFARFLPLWGRGLLLIVTEFDGDMQDYVLDFTAVLDDEFSLILSYMAGHPRLPVSRYPDEFWDYV